MAASGTFVMPSVVEGSALLQFSSTEQQFRCHTERDAFDLLNAGYKNVRFTGPDLESVVVRERSGLQAVTVRFDGPVSLTGAFTRVDVTYDGVPKFDADSING